MVAVVVVAMVVVVAVVVVAMVVVGGVFLFLPSNCTLVVDCLGRRI